MFFLEKYAFPQITSFSPTFRYVNDSSSNYYDIRCQLKVCWLRPMIFHSVHWVINLSINPPSPPPHFFVKSLLNLLTVQVPFLRQPPYSPLPAPPGICCLLHLIRQSLLLKSFQRTLILVIQVSSCLLSLSDLVWNCMITQ